jgi:hypothetical protein
MISVRPSHQAVQYFTDNQLGMIREAVPVSSSSIPTALSSLKAWNGAINLYPENDGDFMSPKVFGQTSSASIMFKNDSPYLLINDRPDPVFWQSIGNGLVYSRSIRPFSYTVNFGGYVNKANSFPADPSDPNKPAEDSMSILFRLAIWEVPVDKSALLMMCKNSVSPDDWSDKEKRELAGFSQQTRDYYYWWCDTFIELASDSDSRLTQDKLVYRCTMRGAKLVGYLFLWVEDDKLLQCRAVATDVSTGRQLSEDMQAYMDDTSKTEPLNKSKFHEKFVQEPKTISSLGLDVVIDGTTSETTMSVKDAGSGPVPNLELKIWEKELPSQ